MKLLYTNVILQALENQPLIPEQAEEQEEEHRGSGHSLVSVASAS